MPACGEMQWTRRTLHEASFNRTSLLLSAYAVLDAGAHSQSFRLLMFLGKSLEAVLAHPAIPPLARKKSNNAPGLISSLSAYSKALVHRLAVFASSVPFATLIRVLNG